VNSIPYVYLSNIIPAFVDSETEFYYALLTIFASNAYCLFFHFISHCPSVMTKGRKVWGGNTHWMQLYFFLMISKWWSVGYSCIENFTFGIGSNGTYKNLCAILDTESEMLVAESLTFLWKTGLRVHGHSDTVSYELFTWRWYNLSYCVCLAEVLIAIFSCDTEE
jgi:hypothetical protein